MRTAKEWGRVAVSLPGWRWMPGMRAVDETGGDTPGRVFDSIGLVVFEDQDRDLTEERVYLHDVPDPDDPATAGCLLAMLEGAGPRPYRRPGGLWVVATGPGFALEPDSLQPRTLGRACIAAAEAIGRWPGGAE
jgi:hypothetical protein